MGLQSDYWVGLGEESMPGTAVTPNVFLFGAGKLSLSVSTVDGQGYRTGYRGVDATRHTITRRQVSGSITEMDAVVPAGLKTLLEAVFGASSKSVVDVTDSINQHLFTPATADYLPSYTIQQASPRLGSSTVDVATFSGCQCKSLKLSVKSGELVGVETEWVGRDQVFNATAAVPSWPAEVDQFGFADGVLQYGSGALTVPTSSALGEHAAAALTGVQDFEITISNALDDNAPTLGSGLVGGRPAAIEAGHADLVKGKFTREYLDRTLIDDAIAQTQRGLLVTFTGRGPSTAYPYALQFALPAAVLSAPFTPESNGGSVITSGHEFTGLQTSAAAVLAVLRTTEA